MRRTVLILVGVAIGAVFLAVAWWWWTAPPRADAGVLADAAAAAPADADGFLVVAQPDRAVRWLLRRPQAALLFFISAPETRGAFSRMQRTLGTLAKEARGPLTVWWRGTELAASARVPSGAARALRTLAALEGLATRSGPVTADSTPVSMSSAPALLGGPFGTPPRLRDAERLAALARIGARWWRVRAGPDRLDLQSGSSPELPPPEGPSAIVTDDVGRLVGAALPPGALPRVPACLAFDANGWALALPATSPGPNVMRMLTLGGDTPAAAPAGARRWRGLLGDVWAVPGPGLAMASRESMLGWLASHPCAGESGTVRGPELSAACVRAADALDALWLFTARAAPVRRAAPFVATVRLARWRILPDGGRITLEW